MRPVCWVTLVLSGLVLLVLLISPPTFGSENTIDSLKMVVKAQENSPAKVDNLIGLSVQYYFLNEPDSVMRYAEEAGEVARAIGYREGIAESYYKMYLADIITDDYKSASIHLRIFNDISEELNDEARLGKGLYSYGTVMDILGKKDSALFYVQKSLVIHLKLKDSARLVANYNSLGNIFMNAGEHDSSVAYLLKAAQLGELSGNRNALGAIYNNLGKLFARMGLYDKARYYLGLALDINVPNNPLLSIQSLSQLGSLFARRGIIDSAFYYYDREAEEIKPLGIVKELGDLNNNYATLYEVLNKPDSALEYFNKAYDIFHEIGYMEGTIMALKNIGRINSIMGKYSLAQSYLDSALNMAVKGNFTEIKRLIYEDMKDNYHMAGDDKKAFQYYDRFFLLYDSMLNVDKVKALDELEKKYQKEKDQARILNLEKENLKKTIQRNITFYTASAIIALIIFTFFYFRQKARKDRIIAQQKIRQLEEEKKLLAAKLLVEGQEEERKRIAMELHDGLGVVLSATKMQFTSIADKSPENKPLIDKAVQLLEQASGDVRRISHNMMPGLLTKMGLNDAVEDLIDNLNDMPGIHAECIVEDDEERLPENKEIMIYRVVQEMVNNTLKHANAKHISLKLKRRPLELELFYSDDGIGFEVEKAMESPEASLGLKSIKSRVDFLGGELKIESEPGKGAKYFIRIPV